ncbi:MAG: CAP domain-containing protein [Mycobacterium sp.]
MSRPDFLRGSRLMTLGPSRGAVVTTLLVVATTTAPVAAADNARLNSGVVANVFTVQHQAGCSTDIRISPALRLAAQWHAVDVVNNRALSGDLGSDGSTPESRATAAGFNGKAVQTVAINNSLAINNLDVINQWYDDPTSFAIMSDCANTFIGVWSENSLDRSVVVAVYGQPA